MKENITFDHFLISAFLTFPFLSSKDIEELYEKYTRKYGAIKTPKMIWFKYFIKPYENGYLLTE